MADDSPDTPSSAPGASAAGPKPWAVVQQSPAFKALPPERQEAVRNAYFDRVVAPKVPAEARERVRARFDEQTAPSNYAKFIRDAKPMTRMERFGTGVKDIVEGGAQLLTHVLPESVVEKGNELNNWLRSKGVPLEELPTKAKGDRDITLDASVKAREAGIQASEKASGVTGTDWYRLGGNVAATLPLAALPGGGATSLGRIAASAGSGAVANILNPVTDDDYWSAKGEQAAIGAATGGVVGTAGEALSKVIAPTFRDSAKTLLDEGVKLTPGQMAGGVARRSEEAMKSVPLLGSAVRNGERQSIESFNSAAINRSLAPIGAKLPKGTPAGNEAIDYAATKLSDAYETLLPRMRGALDAQYRTEIDNVSNLAKTTLPAADAAKLDGIIKNEIIDRFTPTGGVATGHTAKEIESELGRLSSDMGRSTDYDVRKMGGAIKELQASTRRMVERVNPAERGELQKINAGWANLKRVQRAASSVGAKDGVFTPAMLHNAVKALDKSKDKAAFAAGKALMQDLSSAAKDVLPQTVPDSGTPERALWAATVGGGGAAALGHPAVPIAMAAAAAPYTSPGMALLRQYATAMPATRNYLARSIQGLTPHLAPGASLAMAPVATNAMNSIAPQ